MTTFSVTLPWPEPVLSPNEQAHWAVKARAKRKYKEAAYYLTLEALNGGCPEFGQHVRVTYTFRPPADYHYDRDNLIARMKAGQDGIFRALGRDDYAAEPVPVLGEKIAGGCVLVRVEDEHD